MGGGAERGGPERAPSPRPRLPAPSQPSRPHLEAARPCFRCIQTSSGVAWRLCIWAFKYTKGLPRPARTSGSGDGWCAVPERERLSLARERRPIPCGPSAPSSAAERASARRRRGHPYRSQRPPGAAGSPGARGWRHQWPREPSPASCGRFASWVACWAVPSPRRRPSSSSLAMSPPKRTKSWRW